ncbi:MAG: phenylalanine--tRNA ligase beta subunit-related protein [Syntrophorhabdaceae bacterium]
MKENKNAAWIDFSISSAYEAKYLGVPFGLTLISDCRRLGEGSEFDQYKRGLLRKMRKRETLAGISARIDIYDRFFQSFGFECPLPAHLKRTILSGFPRYNLMVDAHFMAEMCAGILVAVTDFNRIQGGLMLDVAREGEICTGMGGRQFILKEGEIVLRDEKDIICVLCQGADEKTKVRDDTRNVLFYSFAVPGINGVYLEEGLDIAARTMAHYGEGNIEGLSVFPEATR